MEQTILKDWQKKVIQFLAKQDGFQSFYLTGGTALAVYYLYHRISDDLDFFSYDPIDPIFIHDIAQRIKNELAATDVRYDHSFDRHMFFYTLAGKEIKIEFTKYPFHQMRPIEQRDGIAVDSEYDIAVNKIATILDRFDPKDFVDLYFLLQKFELVDLQRDVQKKFGITVEQLFLGSELAKVKRITALPQMLKRITVDELKRFFENEAKRLLPDVVESE